MTTKRWIEANLDSDGLAPWIGANVAKFLIEVTLASGAVGPLFTLVYALMYANNASLPFDAAGPLGLYLVLVAGAYKEFWNCRLSNTG